jgi:hypothetical protein
VPLSTTVSTDWPAACKANELSPCELVTPEPFTVSRMPPSTTTSERVSLAEVAAMIARYADKRFKRFVVAPAGPLVAATTAPTKIAELRYLVVFRCIARTIFILLVVIDDE